MFAVSQFLLANLADLLGRVSMAVHLGIKTARGRNILPSKEARDELSSLQVKHVNVMPATFVLPSRRFMCICSSPVQNAQIDRYIGPSWQAFTRLSRQRALSKLNNTPTAFLKVIAKSERVKRSMQETYYFRNICAKYFQLSSHRIFLILIHGEKDSFRNKIFNE